MQLTRCITVLAVLVVLNSNWWQVGGYTIAAALAIRAALRERRELRASMSSDLWPTFWVLTAALLLAMAVGQASDAGDLVADLGRRNARLDGWYESRRAFQAIVVGAVGALWAVVTLVAIWRFPERRRRYLPMTLVVFSLMCFAAIRIVSLHQVDAVLHRRDVAGVRVGVIVELSTVAIAAAMTFWQPAPRTDDRNATADHGALARSS